MVKRVYYFKKLLSSHVKWHMHLQNSQIIRDYVQMQNKSFITIAVQEKQRNLKVNGEVL